jgi:hypothetical protein
MNNKWITATLTVVSLIISSSGVFPKNTKPLDQSDPKLMLQQIYGCAPNGCGYSFDDLPLSQDLASTWRRAVAWSRRKNEPCIDYEPLWQGQEAFNLIANYKLSELVKSDATTNRTQFAVTMYPKEGYEIEGRPYKVGDEPPPDRTVVYAFSKERDRWFVDDILSVVVGGALQPLPHSLRQEMLQCISEP